MQKFLKLFLILILLTSLTYSISEELEVNSSKIDSVQAYSPENISINFEILNETEKTGLRNFGVFTSFKVDMEHYERLEISIKEDEEWAKNFIRQNPDLYNGPGHNYDPGMIFLIKEKGFERQNLLYNNGSFQGKILEPGNYHVVIGPTSVTPQPYIDEQGDCSLYYKGSQYDELEPVEDCEDDNLILIGVILALAIFTLVFVVEIVPILRKKYYIRKLNSLTERLEESQKVDQGILEELYDAMEDVENGNYSEAADIIDKIENDYS